jgi:acetoacetyl-CoA synthetase
VGELVCANPFPSRPLGFFGDADGARFHAAYFAEHPGVWTHGDLIELGPEGGVRLHGRSDGLLNIRGIKLAPAEIARALADEPEVAEVMVVEQAGEPPRVVALLVLASTTAATATATATVAALAAVLAPRSRLALLARLRRTIAQRLSPAHVPDRLLLVPALPVTHNGKPSEAAARAALCGQAPANLLSLRNPECLALIAAAARPDPALALQPRPDSTPDAEPLGAANDAQPAHELLPCLQTLWAEVLGLPAVGPDDHFMDLGGTSLHAAMVLSRLRPLAGCSLPLASLLRAPTPRQLAALARGTTAAGDQAGYPAHRVHPVHPLWVDLRAGPGRPLVLVHGLSGTVMECWPLVQALRGPRPLVGLQARGLDGGPLPPARVEAIAADYVEVLRRAQPQGPYALCGFSFGGLVALEMARLLRAQGEPVEFLGLIDPYLRRGLPAWQQWWLRGRGLLARLAAMDDAGRLAWLQARADRGLVFNGGAADAPPMGPRQRAVRARLESCLARYVPRPFADSPVLFVRAREILPGYFDPATVWRRVLRGPLQIEEVPGSHLQLVSVQAVRLASLIDAALGGTIAAAPDAAADGGLRAVRPTARYATPV